MIWHNHIFASYHLRAYADQLNGLCTLDVHYVLFVYRMGVMGKGKIAWLPCFCGLYRGYCPRTAGLISDVQAE